MKKFKEYTITAEPLNTEILSSILWQLNIDGLYEDVNCLRVYAEPESNVTPELISLELEKLKEQKLLFNYNIQEAYVADKNWNEEWEKSINIIKVSDRIVIKPTFRDYQPSENEIVITIDPKMSFGTGEHQTTRLILKLLEKYTSAGDKVLDVGSGTGVLAIAALKMGADYAVAVDNDEWCYLNAGENSVLNGVQDRLKIIQGIISDINENSFDLAAANIQKNVLTDICSDIYDHLKEGGLVILSGLLDIDEDDILKIYTNRGFELLESAAMDEWIAMVFRKK